MEKTGRIEIEAKTELFSRSLLVIVPFGIIYAINYYSSEILFEWNDFNPNGIITMFYILTILFGAFSLMNLFDNQPKIMFNKQGLSLRKNFLPFSPMKLLSWTDVEYITLESEKQKHTTSTFLTIKNKKYNKSKRLDLDYLDQPTEEILAVIRRYSTIINFRDRSKITG